MPDRHQEVVRRLALRPDHRVLEIGGGHGVTASLVCAQLVEGRYTGVDRSARMVEAAARRNAAAVQQGRAEFLVADLTALDLGDRRFDLAFAVRVAAFHRDPERTRELIGPWLSPGARVVSFLDIPGGELEALPILG